MRADTGDGLQTLAALFQRWVFGQERLELPFDGGDQITEGGEGTAGFAFEERRTAQALFEGNRMFDQGSTSLKQSGDFALAGSRRPIGVADLDPRARRSGQ